MATEEKKKKGWFRENVFDWGSDEETNEDTASESTETTDTVDDGSTELSGVSLDDVDIEIPETGDGVFDKKFHESLSQLIAENNIPGIDYFEFNQALENLKKSGAGMAENSMFNTVYSTLKVGDPTLTRQKLLESCDFYIKVLSEEEQGFEVALEEEISNKVTARTNKVAQLEQENADKAAQIQQLQEEISANQQEQIKLKGEAAQDKAKIEQTQKNFQKTLGSLVTKIEGDKTKIISLIQDGAETKSE